MRLKNKTAIVTGAGSGIGRAIALLFSKEGAKVVVADWSEKGGGETAEQIKKKGGEVIFVKTDVSKSGDIDKMVKACLKEFGQVDILVNNAGIHKGAPLDETNEKDWDKIIDVDLKGVFLGSKKVVPEMIKRGKGKIINTASIAGMVGFSEMSAYCAAKGGVISLTKEMALELASKKINVNCISPGVIKTPMSEKILKDPAVKKNMKASTPYPRLGEPEDIAHAALYLASDESDFVTGENLVVDGGWTVK